MTKIYSLVFKMAFVLLLSVSSNIVLAQDNVEKQNLDSAPSAEAIESATQKLGLVNVDTDTEEKEEKEEKLLPVETLTGDPQIEEMVRRLQLYAPDILMQQIGSLFFTAYEQNLIEDARKGLVARAPTDFEISDSIKDQKEGSRPTMGPRELAVGGIVYISSGDWTVWINGQKITPDRLPSEILDIRVYKNYIKIKWFDAYTNQIFPIKIKTHQRFNIDTRIFLPG